MMIHILFFASLADRLGIRQISIPAPDGATVAQVLDLLTAQFPALADFREGLATAVNMAYARPDHRLGEGDDLALIPPVSGG